MLFSNIAFIGPQGNITENAYIGIKDKKIAYISQQPPKEDFGEIYAGENKLLIPGIINCHSHIPMALTRGYGEGLPLDRWLNERIFPFEDRLNGERAYIGSMLGIAEMLASGITSFSDMYYFCQDIACAVEKSGIKANLSRAVVSFEEFDIHKNPRSLEMLDLYNKYHGLCDGRILVDYSIHGEYTNKEGVIRQIAQAAAEDNAAIHLHLSETLKEHEECKQRHGGRTPARFLADCGIFNVPVLAAHCVHVEEDDIGILSQNGATVAHCPSSNMKLGSGVAPISELLQAGVNVALGTDGAGSNNNLNMLEEAHLAQLIQCGFHRDPLKIVPAQTFNMLSAAGAKAQGREDTGSIELGKYADLAVVDMDRPHLTPCFNGLDHLIYSAQGSDVVLTMVNGRVLYKDGEYLTIDIERVKYLARGAVNDILEELGG